MKLNNFELIKTTGVNSLDKVYHALVDVETGILWWKKVERLGICRKYGDFWFFVETGEWVRDETLAALTRSYYVKTGQEC